MPKVGARYFEVELAKAKLWDAVFEVTKEDKLTDAELQYILTTITAAHASDVLSIERKAQDA